MAVGVPAGQSLASKASEAFMDWMRKATYNVAARSRGAPGMLGGGQYGLGELITMATTPIHEEELTYTGSFPKLGGLTISTYPALGHAREIQKISYQELSEEETMNMLEMMK